MRHGMTVRIAYNHGFSVSELIKVQELVRVNEATIQEAWHEYFDRD